MLGLWVPAAAPADALCASFATPPPAQGSAMAVGTDEGRQAGDVALVAQWAQGTGRRSGHRRQWHSLLRSPSLFCCATA